MLHRIASRARTPWSTLVAALALTATAPLLRGGAAPIARMSVVELHVKVRAGAVLPAGLHAYALFTALPAGTHDGRERWQVVEVTTARDDDSAAAAIAADPAIEDAFVEPVITLPIAPTAPARDDDSCPITTPSFEEHQGYVGAAPGGIDAPAAWRLGVRGQGVWFADVEGGWNATHEDLPGDRMTHVHGIPVEEPSWRAHGTAVLGEVVGRDNRKGVVGIAPDVDRVMTSSIMGSQVADAIDAAAEALRPGDVLLIELQGVGPRRRYLPVEYWNDVFDVIAAATARGVIVIEAAGNGAEDLDLRAYHGRFDRSRRDSGAILVGAGAPPRDGYADRERLDFSNYGARVDVQGWGRKVATLDYGDLQACTDATRDRHYTGEFSGTSSASPIVAGAAVLIQSTARLGGRVFTPAAMRALLVATGSPQLGNVREHIGPRPNLAAALRFVPAP